MMDLRYFRPTYVVEGGAGARLQEAHRLMRTVIAVACVVRSALFSEAHRVIERIENILDDDERRLSSGEVSVLAVLASDVAATLAEALDCDHRPRGVAGERILREAARPSTINGILDGDRVFERHADGTIGLHYPRMNLHHFLDDLPMLVALLQQAADGGYSILLEEE